MIHRKLLTIFVTLTLVASSLQAKPLRELVSYPELETLVKASVAKVPDLQPLWTWAKPGVQPAYVGGGALRGLLHWLRRQLQTKGPAEVLALDVPPMTSLVLQPQSDLDLFTRDNLVEELKEDRPQYAAWDILNESFCKASLEAGGPALEKLRVSPTEIVDPAGGLRDYYEGTLKFLVTPDSGLRENKILRFNSRLAQALRFLRMLEDLPELEADPKALSFIRGIYALEGPVLTRHPSTDYWIEKGLKKLFTATGKKRKRTLAILERANLLGILEQKGYDTGFMGENGNVACFWEILAGLH
jgi:hypothetical protein